MGSKRRGECNVGEKVKLIKHAGLPPKACESLHSSLLNSTAQYRVPSHDHPPLEEKVVRPGKLTRAMARAAADQQGLTATALPPLPVPPAELSPEEVLNRRLQHIRSLKVFYERAHLSMLAHLTELASAMRMSQTSVLHELDPQMPRPRDTSKDGGGNGAQPARNEQDDRSLLSPRQGVTGPRATGSTGITSPKAAGVHRSMTSPRAVASTSALGVTSPKALSKLEVASPTAVAAPLPTFSEAEDEVLRHYCSGRHSGSGGGPQSPLLERLSKGIMSVTASMQELVNNMQGLADFERVAASAAARDMDRREACAVLCGQHTRFYLHQTMVIIGRKSKTKGEVDVDLTLEGPSTKLSRIQCLLELDLQMGYVLRNLGRQSILVNNMEVGQGQKIKVPHMSLLEIGGIRVLFLSNQAAVRRMMLLPAPCPKTMEPV